MLVINSNTVKVTDAVTTIAVGYIATETSYSTISTLKIHLSVKRSSYYELES